MRSVITCVLAVLIVCLLQTITARRLDCTKFVFAPRCRGVSAKRASGGASAQQANTIDQILPPASNSEYGDWLDMMTGADDDAGTEDNMAGNQQRLKEMFYRLSGLGNKQQRQRQWLGDYTEE